MSIPALRPNLRPCLIALAAILALLGLMAPASAQYNYQEYTKGGSSSKPKITPPSAIKSRAALLIDAQTGKILFARNEDERLLPASTTKLMTALIVYEKIGFKGKVTITSDDKAEPSNIPVVTGESISVDTLFHALLIESANDSARALGRYVAGSDKAFVQMMNERARLMGLTNTHFYNANGLPAPAGTHYTSCSDLMAIFRAVIAYPDLAKLCETKEARITTASGTHILRNHNRLLGYYPGMGPAKTGWTETSRHTYAASVTRDGRQILLIILDSPDKWTDAEILFNWAFAQTPPSPVAPAGATAEAPPRLPIRTAQPASRDTAQASWPTDNFP